MNSFDSVYYIWLKTINAWNKNIFRQTTTVVYITILHTSPNLLTDSYFQKMRGRIYSINIKLKWF